MYAHELKILAVISMFCLMALACLAVASFIYTNTQDKLIQQAAMTGVVTQQYASNSHQPKPYSPNPVVIRGVIA